MPTKIPRGLHQSGFLSSFKLQLRNFWQRTKSAELYRIVYPLNISRKITNNSSRIPQCGEHFHLLLLKRGKKWQQQVFKGNASKNKELKG